MKLTLFALLFALVGCTASKYGAETKNLTVISIKKEGLKTTVIARTNKGMYKAKFDYLPDSVKRGTVIRAYPSDKDTCACVFKRIR